MKRYAFTMLELVMVIVVLGILAIYTMPRMDRSIRQEAADSILSAIRYTQHLALNDDKTDPTDPDWQKYYWHIRFASRNSAKDWFYTISSNTNRNTNVNKTETAIDPSNGKRFFNSLVDYDIDPDESPDIFLTKRFGISGVSFDNCTVQIGSSGTNNAAHVAFDQLGRPHKGIYGATHDFGTMMQADCTIVFSFASGGPDDFNITIQADTGYAQIGGQENS